MPIPRCDAGAGNDDPLAAHLRRLHEGAHNLRQNGGQPAAGRSVLRRLDGPCFGRRVGLHWYAVVERAGYFFAIDIIVWIIVDIIVDIIIIDIRYRYLDRHGQSLGQGLRQCLALDDHADRDRDGDHA